MRPGTKLMAVFLQHICSEVNTLTGVVLPFWLLLSSLLPSGFFSENSEYREEGRNGCAQVLFHLSLSSPKPDVTSL